MSYDTLIATAFGKRPIWLYEFVRDGTTTRLCAARSDYTDADSQVWTAAPITHTKIRTTSAIGRAETEIVMPQSNTFARTFLTDLSYADNTLTIYREFQNQAASPSPRATKFKGRVIGVSPRLTRLMFIAENSFTELRRKGLSAVMQRPCRHALYHSKDGLGCGLSIGDFNTAGTLTAFASNVATVTEASGQSDGYYSGGVLTYDGKRQLITSHSGTSLTLLGPISGLADDLAAASPSQLSVSIAPGCDLTRATCNTRFSNLANFGGFPWMTETPFDGKTLF